MLSARVNCYFKEKSGGSNLDYIVSACDEIGEGEHKISLTLKNPDYHSQTNTVIYGLDADLIMLVIITSIYMQ